MCVANLRDALGCAASLRALSVHLLSWSSLYCMSRALANSSESALCSISSYLLLQQKLALKVAGLKSFMNVMIMT